VLQASESNNANGKPFEGVPLNIPADKIIAQFHPFRPPPPPQPFNDHSTAEQVKPKKKNMERRARRTKSQKSWSTTIIVTEYTNPDDGSNTYSVSSTPITRLSDPQIMEIREPGIGSKIPVEQPFLQRMWIRGQKWEDFKQRRREGSGTREMEQRSMVLISVKRQRKLKMKKHKYKKLMRRTRNLRRRLGKIWVVQLNFIRQHWKTVYLHGIWALSAYWFSQSIDRWEIHHNSLINFVNQNCSIIPGYPWYRKPEIIMPEAKCRLGIYGERTGRNSSFKKPRQTTKSDKEV